LRLFLLTITMMMKSIEAIVNDESLAVDVDKLREKNEELKHHVTVMYALATHEQHDNNIVSAAEFFMEKLRVSFQKNDPIFG
jgi:hypothetical protein